MVDEMLIKYDDIDIFSFYPPMLNQGSKGTFPSLVAHIISYMTETKQLSLLQWGLTVGSLEKGVIPASLSHNQKTPNDFYPLFLQSLFSTSNKKSLRHYKKTSK